MDTAPIIDDVAARLRHIELAWIPMSDGRRLAARLWLPDDAEQSPCRRSWNTSPIAGATARGRAMRDPSLGRRAMAMPAPGSISPAAAIPTGCCGTNI